MTLKEARIKSGIHQKQVAEQLKCSISLISEYENIISMPTLEHAATLNRIFNTKIDYPETMSPTEKVQVLQAVSELTAIFPFYMVADYCSKVLRRHSDPVPIILDFAKSATSRGHEPLSKPKTDIK